MNFGVTFDYSRIVRGSRFDQSEALLGCGFGQFGTVLSINPC